MPSEQISKAALRICGIWKCNSRQRSKQDESHFFKRNYNILPQLL